jgi:cyclophilin family peptidyl-prolyl cis-trans isomerase
MYAEGGQDAFKKTKPPSAYDWTGMAPATPRPKAYFDIQIDGEKTGKLEFELASEVVPETVANFTRLCKGQGIKYPGYKDTNVHLLRKGQLFMGGDIEKKDGTGSYSSYESRYIPDENHVIAHTDRGILR